MSTNLNLYIITSRHGDFKKVEATRPDFDPSAPISISKTPNPTWSFGQGAPTPTNPDSLSKQHIEIDPFESGRPMLSNYKLLISGIVPRPIGFLSTTSPDGTANLAPFSYFQAVDHDPPIFVVGFSARVERPKDTLRNLKETGECVINIVSEHMIDAVNATSIDVPYVVSEWTLSGLNAAESTTVKPPRVKESVFSIEAKVLEIKGLNYHSKGDGKPHGSLAIIEATRFWVREDALSEGRDHIDLGVLRPVAQLGGISYGRVRDIFELPRTSYKAEVEKGSGIEAFVDEKGDESGSNEVLMPTLPY
jgi:flavin reductase (DIM6/NTAB) family NADH-FMN oxidoreductase RutF